MNDTIDYTKPVETKDGHEVEVYSTDNGGDYPVHIRHKHENGFWYPDSRTLDGKAYKSSDDPKDLIQKKEKITLWFNVFTLSCGVGFGTGKMYLSEGEAIRDMGTNSLSCIGTYPVTIEV